MQYTYMQYTYMQYITRGPHPQYERTHNAIALRARPELDACERKLDRVLKAMGAQPKPCHVQPDQSAWGGTNQFRVARDSGGVVCVRDDVCALWVRFFRVFIGGIL